ncbi:MAG: response regulator, partial [Calditrichia bacterium]|nr:response regulator [Calditrichia bacterium]
DDDADLIEQNQAVLEAAGYNIEVGYDSKEGLEKFKSFKPDVAIIDLNMETHDSGFILCHRIRSLDEGKDVKIFILTSASKDTGYRFSVNSGEEKKWIKADGYLDKPIKPTDLAEFIKQKVFHEKTEH